MKNAKKLYGVLFLLFGLTALSLEISLAPLIMSCYSTTLTSHTRMLVLLFFSYPCWIGSWIAILMVIVGTILCCRKEK